MSYETLVGESIALIRSADERIAILKAFHEELSKAVTGTSSQSEAKQFATGIVLLQKARNECSQCLGLLQQDHRNWYEKPASTTSLFEKSVDLVTGIGGSIAHPVKFGKAVAMKIEHSATLKQEYGEKETNLINSREALKQAMASPSDKEIADLRVKYLSPRDRSWTISPP